MNKNLLKLTSILCSLTAFSSFAAIAKPQDTHNKPTGQNVSVQEADNYGQPEEIITGPNGNTAYIGGGKSGEGSAQIAVSTSKDPYINEFYGTAD